MRIRSLLVAMSTATLVALAPTGATEAQSGTQVILAHGLNLNGQDSTQDRGSNVTVCRNGSVLLDDFQFGDIIGPALVPTGVEISLTVFSGADVDCEAPGGAELLIDTTFTPDEDPVALIRDDRHGWRTRLRRVAARQELPHRWRRSAQRAACERRHRRRGTPGRRGTHRHVDLR